MKAVGRGWPQASGVFGETLTVTLHEFDDYVANEERSCFVEGVKLYHSNPLTDQGMVIVDTPGADSINARHTGVAFNYIKNADAILFVTYYNHAFSQADREFLLQLGRVKDTFELDKMFFIVNAADLAKDQEELDAVVSHVEANLLAQGVRNARIYPLSSQQAVAAKLAKDADLLNQSGIATFEREFIRFTLEELTDIAVRSASSEFARAAAILQEWITQAAKGKAEREAEVQRLQEAYAKLEQLVQSEWKADWHADLEKEIAELLYYVKQRVGFRFTDLYNLAFNPSALADGGDKGQALRACHYDLHRLLSYDLSQEVLATTLRVEQWMNRTLEQLLARWRENYAVWFPEFPHETYDAVAFATPQVEEFLDAVEPNVKMLLKMYKNGKSFFEGNGKELLKAELEQQFGIVMERYAERHQALLTTSYQKQMAEAHQQRMAKEMESLGEQVQGWTDALQLSVDLEQLKAARQRLLQLSEA
ncbi:dynamin family protein [Paenibacillus senegalensis]|uniref:dynamin family protein n=1 Tax=Paenibacillus senegalensis TaxID=1465766 RepID=UPI0002DCE36C|nr:dynamin family protein [Paenibacillus senegalensis]